MSEKQVGALEEYAKEYMQPITQELVDSLREDPYPCQIVIDFIPYTNDRDTFREKDGVKRLSLKVQAFPTAFKI